MRVVETSVYGNQLGQLWIAKGVIGFSNPKNCREEHFRVDRFVINGH